MNQDTDSAGNIYFPSSNTIEILSPESSSDSAFSMKLLQWLKSEGDFIYAGEVLAEIETEKAVVEVEAPESGVVTKLIIRSGAEVASSEVIALLAAESTRISEDTKGNQPAIPISALNGSIDSSLLDVTKKSLDHSNMSGMVPHNNSTDVQSFSSHSVIPNSAIRKTIARRLLESKQTIPHFYLTVQVDMDALQELRFTLSSRPDVDDKLSINDFVIKAAGMALRQVPAVNSTWTPTAVLCFDSVDVSVAVTVEGGLLTPVIRNADKKDIETIHREVKSLITKAHNGKLKSEEMQGGGFTISNLGMYGVQHFSAIINPPQSCILAVGALEKRAIVRNDIVVILAQMTVTLSADHRSIDGVVGAEFLAAFKTFIEDPMRMI